MRALRSAPKVKTGLDQSPFVQILESQPLFLEPFWGRANLWFLHAAEPTLLLFTATPILPHPVKTCLEP